MSDYPWNCALLGESIIFCTSTYESILKILEGVPLFSMLASQFMRIFKSFVQLYCHMHELSVCAPCVFMCVFACVSMEKFHRCKLMMYQLCVPKGVLYLGENRNYGRHREFSYKAIS